MLTLTRTTSIIQRWEEIKIRRISIWKTWSLCLITGHQPHQWSTETHERRLRARRRLECLRRSWEQSLMLINILSECKSNYKIVHDPLNMKMQLWLASATRFSDGCHDRCCTFLLKFIVEGSVNGPPLPPNIPFFSPYCRTYPRFLPFFWSKLADSVAFAVWFLSMIWTLSP